MHSKAGEQPVSSGLAGAPFVRPPMTTQSTETTAEGLTAAGASDVGVRSLGGPLLDAAAGEPEQRRVPRSGRCQVAP